MTFLLFLAVSFLLGYVFWLKAAASSRAKAMSILARSASRLMHSLDGELRRAAAEKRAQRDLLALAGALSGLFEDNPELLTSDMLDFLWQLSFLVRGDSSAKEKKELVSRIETLRVRMNKN